MRFIKYILLILFSVICLAGCSRNEPGTLKVAATSIPHAMILEKVKPDLKAKGIDLDIIVIDDYRIPNRALSDGEVDANFFQHKPFLEVQKRDFGYTVTGFADIHIEPLGLYSKKHLTLANIKEKATIAVPNDPSNLSRALNLLEDAGILKLKKRDITATAQDIAANPQKVEIIEVDAALLSRVLDDVDFTVIPANFALQADLSPRHDALAKEDSRSLYANILAIREGDEERPELIELKKALTSKSTGKYIDETFKGSVIPAFDPEEPVPIYFYTDFGGGKNNGENIYDVQTSREIASAAWKTSLRKKIRINDSAVPLSPMDAANTLAATFPYRENKESKLHIIVVHVVDPGVGNGENEHKRSIVLRKDGVLFIGPDNGTLSYVVPKGSIADIREIDPDALYKISGIDVLAGGTFHGRDLFAETAFRLAANQVHLDEISKPYQTAELLKRFPDYSHQKKLPVTFDKVETDRFTVKIPEVLTEDEIFSYAYLFGMIQSPIYNESTSRGKSLFFADNGKADENDIVIFNKKTDNIYIGPNNGIGTVFFKGFTEADIESRVVGKERLHALLTAGDNEHFIKSIFHEPPHEIVLRSVAFYGTESDIFDGGSKDCKIFRARIWIDPYGNIKTTASGRVLDMIKSDPRTEVSVRLNGVDQKVIFADSFSAVSKDRLFAYNGSTATWGPNPRRSHRYVEISANGIYGKFGIDFFKNGNKEPYNGQDVYFVIEPDPLSPGRVRSLRSASSTDMSNARLLPVNHSALPPRQ